MKLRINYKFQILVLIILVVKAFMTVLCLNGYMELMGFSRFSYMYILASFYTVPEISSDQNIFVISLLIALILNAILSVLSLFMIAIKLFKKKIGRLGLVMVSLVCASDCVCCFLSYNSSAHPAKIIGIVFNVLILIFIWVCVYLSCNINMSPESTKDVALDNSDEGKDGAILYGKEE